MRKSREIREGQGMYRIESSPQGGRTAREVERGKPLLEHCIPWSAVDLKHSLLDSDQDRLTTEPGVSGLGNRRKGDGSPRPSVDAS